MRHSRVASTSCHALMILSCLFLVVPPGLAQGTGSHGLAGRFEPVTEDYLTGYLFAEGASSGITWDPRRPSETSVLPWAPQSNPGAQLSAPAGELVWSAVGDDAQLRPWYVVKSEPAPRTLHVDVTRLIQIDLLRKNDAMADHLRVVELYAGDKLLAGALVPNNFDQKYVPPEPSQSWVTIRYRLQAELDVVPAGTVITLKVLPRGDPSRLTSLLELGANEDHRTLIRIPFYDAIEVQSRIVPLEIELKDGEGEAPKPPLPSADLLDVAWLAPAGVAGLSLGASSKNRRTWLISVALLMLAVSGCTGANPTPQEATPTGLPPSLVRTDYSDQALGDPGTGSVFGIVHDENNVPVADAHVALLSTPASAQTDELGRFLLENVTVGQYRLRIDAETVNSTEVDVPVRAGQVTRLDITVSSSLEPGLRPHVHDYWGDERSVVFLEQKVQLVGTSAQQDSGLCGGHCRAFVPMPRPTTDGSALIRPGTYDVEVTLAWPNSPGTFPNLAVGFVPNHDPGSVAQGSLSHNDTLMYPRKSGVPTHIRTGWEMTDVGHQTFSNWILFVEYRSTLWDAHQVPVPAPTVDVQIRIHKGVVPLEPGHRDFWGEQKELLVLEPAAKVAGTCATSCAYPKHGSGWTPERLVPPGTTHLALTFEQDKPSLPNPNDWGILYKPANVPRQNDYSQFQKAQATSTGALRKEFIIPVAPAEADPFYAKVSNWYFALDDGQAGTITMTNEVTFTLSVKALRSERTQATKALSVPGLAGEETT